MAVGALIGYLVAADEAAPFEQATHARAVPQHAVRPPISPRARRVGASWVWTPPVCVVLARMAVSASATSARPRQPWRRCIMTEPVLKRLDPMSFESCPSRLCAGRLPSACSRAHTTAAVTLTTTIDATNLVNLRAQFKAVAGTSGSAEIGITDIVVKLAALVIEQHPLLHCAGDGDRIVVPTAIHIGLAVDTDAGLFVPVIRDVARLSLRQLAATSRELIARARSGTLTSTELHGGTFTITNLGAFGIETFTPLVNPPECAVLGLGRIAAPGRRRAKPARGAGPDVFEPDFRSQDCRRRPGGAVPPIGGSIDREPEPVARFLMEPQK